MVLVIYCRDLPLFSSFFLVGSCVHAGRLSCFSSLTSSSCVCVLSSSIIHSFQFTRRGSSRRGKKGMGETQGVCVRERGEEERGSRRISCLLLERQQAAFGCGDLNVFVILSCSELSCCFLYFFVC
jgi:hypothetical protein